MIYDISKNDELKILYDFIELQKNKNKTILIEVKIKHLHRTYNQNRYCHLLLKICALEVGENLEYFKEEYWKKNIAKDIFLSQYINPISGKVRDDYKSSSDLTTKEMTDAIEKLKDWAATDLGIDLPEANMFELIRMMENKVESNSKWL